MAMIGSEHAELWLNFICSDEERAALEKHRHDKDRLAEGERFMCVSSSHVSLFHIVSRTHTRTFDSHLK